MVQHEDLCQEERIPEVGLETAVVGARDGDGHCLATLYRALHPALLRYLRARDPRAAEDLASETWLKVADSLASFKGDASAFRSWVFTIARCRLIDHQRQASRRGDALDPAVIATHPSSDDPEAEILAIISAEAALRVMRRLPPDQMDAIVLRVVGGLKTAEVAAVMGKREGAVRVLQHRGLRRLAKMFEDEL